MKLKTITLLLMLAASASAQRKPKPDPNAGNGDIVPNSALLNQPVRQLSEAHKYQLILKYQKAMQLQAQFQQAAREYQEIQKQDLMDDGYPEPCGQPKTNDCSNVAIDTQAETVTVSIAPPAAAPTTPAKPVETPKPPTEKVPPLPTKK